MRCPMTGQPLRDTSDGIYDDGEWISWDWINGHIADQELRGEFPNANLEVVKIFQDLVALAACGGLTILDPSARRDLRDAGNPAREIGEHP